MKGKLLALGLVLILGAMLICCSVMKARCRETFCLSAARRQKVRGG